jgi:hypothetical protein
MLHLAWWAVDKDSLSLTKQSAMHLATLGSHCAAVQLLLEHGAKLIFSAAEAKTKKARISSHPHLHRTPTHVAYD